MLGNFHMIFVCQENLTCDQSVLLDNNQNICTNIGSLQVLKRHQANTEGHFITMESFDALLEVFEVGRIDYLFAGNADFVVNAWVDKYQTYSVLPHSAMYHYVSARYAALLPLFNSALEAGIARLHIRVAGQNQVRH